MTSKIPSLNSRGFSKLFQDYLIYSLRTSYDVFCFQETKITDPEVFRVFSCAWRGPCFWSPAVGKQGGVLTCLSESFSGNVSRWKRDTSGRVVSLLLKLDDLRINLINIYAPTNLAEKKVFFRSLHEYFLPSDVLIIAGDYNCYDHNLDKFGGNFVPAKCVTDLRSAFSLIDVWRKLHPRVCQCTWFNSDFSIGSRLDKFFVSKNFMPSVVSCEINPCVFSDHDFVCLSFQPTGNNLRGPGIWKFNNSLLNDDVFCDYISNCINHLANCLQHFPSVKVWWDFFKNSIRSEIIFFAREKSRDLSHERVLLVNRIIELKRQLTSGNPSVSPEISELESKLKALTLEKLDGSKIRSRVQWLEEGERPTRFFFKLERERFERNIVSSILNSDDVEVFTREEIERAHVRFYSDLFTDEPIDAFFKQRCLESVEKSLSPPQRASCEGSLSLDELTNSVKSLNTGKSPGSDGLSVEFYLRFWETLGPLLLRVSNQCFSDGELCGSMKGSVTRLIFKKRGDIKHLKNWRPISLLNVDYKIISKAITSRLSKVLEYIVHPDQTCSVPGRSIFSNVTLLHDVLDYIQRTDESAILVSLDQEKAFDRVNRSFLLHLLQVYGFGPEFCRWISTFYNGAFMQIILNGWLSQRISLARGVRQGDPLSPLLYVLCVEVLASLIRRCPGVEGFLLPGARGRQARVRLYADDTTTVLKDLRSLSQLFSCVNVYERGTGAKLNRTKTEAMWLGAWRFRSDEPLGLTWVKKMKILGEVFGTIPTEHFNWQPKLEKLEKSLNLWKSRSLSLPGKALIINTLGLSKLLYLARVLTLPKWVIARVNALIWPFLWGSKMETVSRNTCFLKLKFGGVNLDNLVLKAQALRLAGMASVLNSPDDSSFFLCKYFLGRRLSSMRSEWSSLRDNSSPSASSPTPFYEDCLDTLSRVGDSALVCKTLYQKLLSINSSPPILPRQWSQVIGPGFSLDGHWSLVRDPFTENYKNDVFWLIILRGVKVRDSLFNWGCISSGRCASCPRRETIDHCFLNCLRVKRVWLHFVPALSLLLGRQFVANLLTVFFFRWPSLSAKRARLARHLTKSILYGIWTFRNRATFCNGKEDHRAIIRYVSYDLKQRVFLDYNSLSESRFHDVWVLDGFCAMANGFPHINI